MTKPILNSVDLLIGFALGYIIVIWLVVLINKRKEKILDQECEIEMMKLIKIHEERNKQIYNNIARFPHEECTPINQSKECES